MSFFQRLRKVFPRRAAEPAASKPVRVVTDSTADLPPEIAEELGIEVVPLQVIFGSETFRDGIDLTSEEFFRKLPTAEQLPTTSQPSVGDFLRVYEALAAQTDQIISIHLSERFSGTVQTARRAAQELIGRCRIEVIDSGTVSMAMGLAVMAAAKEARAGATLEACAGAAHSVLRRQQIAVALDTLEYLRRGGRIGRAQAFLGSLLQLKPILTIRNGQAQPLTRVRTRKKALDEILRVCLDGVAVSQVAIMHSTSPDDAQVLATEVARRCPDAELYSGRIGPVIGVHGGPGLIAMAVVRVDGGGSL